MFSIVTATMNLQLDELKPILAVYDSYFEDGLSFELIIQDNNSDKVVQAVLRERPYVDLVSATDTGIYDAWNQALPRVKGNWVGFLGIDDLPSRDWVSFVATFGIAKKLSVLACDVSMIDGNHIHLGTHQNPRHGSLNTKANTFAHPGLAVAADTFKGRCFPDQYQIIGDLVFYGQFAQLPVIGHLGAVGVSMEIGGISNSPKGARRVLKEYLKAVKKGDIQAYVPLIAKRMVAAALSFFPRWYLFVQKKRWALAGK